MAKSAYEIIRRPVITEKGLGAKETEHTLVFEVSVRATKTQIKEAVQFLFDVEVEDVHVIVMPAKRGRRGRSRRMVVRNAEYKKAVVTIRADQSIAFFEGVKK